MGNVRFQDEKVLFVSEHVAMHADCCCEEVPPCWDCDCEGHCSGDIGPSMYWGTYLNSIGVHGEGWLLCTGNCCWKGTHDTFPLYAADETPAGGGTALVIEFMDSRWQFGTMVEGYPCGGPVVCDGTMSGDFTCELGGTLRCTLGGGAWRELVAEPEVCE